MEVGSCYTYPGSDDHSGSLLWLSYVLGVRYSQGSILVLLCSLLISHYEVLSISNFSQGPKIGMLVCKTNATGIHSI